MANTTSASLKLTVQQTGENSGTWGQFTNTNLLILEQAIGGYTGVALNATTGATLTFSNGVLSNGKDQVIKLTGTITSNVNVVIPDGVEKTYLVENATSGAFTVTFKTSSGTGVTWATTDKTKKLIYSDGTNVINSGLISEIVQDTSPQLGADLDTNSYDIQFDDATGIRDDSDNEQLIFQKTASAVNYIEVTNNSTGNNPKISVEGSDTNIGLSLATKGTGNVSVTGHFVASANDTYDLGTSTVVWRNIYTGDLHLNNEHKTEGNFIDGTKGSWTLQEGASDLFVINNKSGEKYKLKLEKI